MTCVHPLKTDLPKPAHFTDPFCYEPHPLCLLAVEEVKQELACMPLTEGKMFGVLVVERSERREVKSEKLGFLAAYSGLLEGRNDWPYFVPPVFDAQQPDGFFKTKEHEISLCTLHSPLSTKKMSQELQTWLFRQYQLLNARGEEKDLVEIWQDYHSSPRIRDKYPLPPGGTGDCCAPKLLQYAYQHNLKPVSMAEFWWGESPKSLIRHHGQFYPACRGKCKPVLTWMLQGLDVDPHTDASRTPQEPAIIYEDEVMAVLFKPAGMLSVPGKTDDDSVAAWAQAHWSGAMLVHRLDMLTSGILLVAKTMEVYQHLQKQFTDRTVKKKYLAIVEGSPAKEHGIIDLPLASDPMNRPLQIVDHENGKRAITEYRVVNSPLSTLRSPLTLLALWPHTGRTHQLRMHCAHPEGLGCPIVGDELYGQKADRLYLQAQAITFVHPLTEKRIHFELPYPFEQIFPYHY